SGAGHQPLGPRALRPRLGGQEETVPTRLISNSLEFEGIKIQVVNPLPDAEEQHRVLVLQPLFDERATALEVSHHVRERDVIAMLLGNDPNGRALDFDGGWLGFAHAFISMKW